MLYFHKEKLIILCQPKTGTTALHDAISRDASIAFVTPPHMKHMTYAKFMNALSTWIVAGGEFHRRKYTIVSVMREPLDWFGSWYRYNTREQLASTKSRAHSRYTGDITFDQFLEALLLPREEAPDYAKLGGPSSVALDENKRIGVDYLFRYTDMAKLTDFISERLERPIVLEHANISAKKEITVDPEIASRIREKYAFDFEVYSKLRPNGWVTKELKLLESSPVGVGEAVRGL